jgi:hypothetical protein
VVPSRVVSRNLGAIAAGPHVAPSTLTSLADVEEEQDALGIRAPSNPGSVISEDVKDSVTDVEAQLV